MVENKFRVEAFFSNARKWQKELLELRAILLACPLNEEFKWRSPCYTYRGSNVVTIWGLKEYCTLSFFKGVLLEDSKRLLVAPGENSRSVRMFRFRNSREIADMEAILKDYIGQAIEVEKAGLKVDFRNDDLKFPDELTRKLNEDPELKQAFQALTPGRQRGYALYFSRPKQSRTRIARIEKCAAGILDGKGLHDR